MNSADQPGSSEICRSFWSWMTRRGFAEAVECCPHDNEDGFLFTDGEAADYLDDFQDELGREFTAEEYAELLAYAVSVGEVANHRGWEDTDVRS